MASFATTLDEAKAKHDKYRSIDPFPQIQPALLNSADICDYVAATGMIHPFYFEASDLKPASYAIRLEGDYIVWNDRGERVEGRINNGDRFELKSDSIAFVSLEPLLQLPDYIAARFNLKINNIYRGLLLGTGPLVDPGFVGHLSIPLHNLTTNDYIFHGGEPLIWIEFTKLSLHSRWNSPSETSMLSDADRVGKYMENTVDRINLRTLSDLLREADPHRPIRSSIPRAIFEASRAAEDASSATREASKMTDTMRMRVNVVSWIGILGLSLTLGIFIYNIIDIKNQTLKFVTDAESRQIDFYDRVHKEYQEHQQDRVILDALRKEVDSLKTQLRPPKPVELTRKSN